MSAQPENQTGSSPTPGNAQFSAAPGRGFLILSVTLENTSSDALYFSRAAFRLYDAAGAQFQRAHALEGTLRTSSSQAIRSRRRWPLTCRSR